MSGTTTTITITEELRPAMLEYDVWNGIPGERGSKPTMWFIGEMEVEE